MKKLSLFIAFAMLAALTMVSCNNKPKEPTAEEIQAQKQALADSVLAEIDALVDEYSIAAKNGVIPIHLELTEKEKQVKPDYLLDPAEANKFVTKSQKVNALAIYIQELWVREIYEMPTEEVREAIARLAAEVNHPFDFDQLDANAPLSERIMSDYEKCKENGDLALFWQFENAITADFAYIIAQNPELFFSEITEEQWQSFTIRIIEKNKAMKVLAKYDEEMASVEQLHAKTRVYSSDEEMLNAYASIKSAKQHFIANKDKYIVRRNALLQ